MSCYGMCDATLCHACHVMTGLPTDVLACHVMGGWWGLAASRTGRSRYNLKEGVEVTLSRRLPRGKREGRRTAEACGVREVWDVVAAGNARRQV